MVVTDPFLISDVSPSFPLLYAPCPMPYALFPMPHACPVKQPKGLPVVDRGFTWAPCPMPYAPHPQSLNSPIPQFPNPPIPKSLNPQIPQPPKSKRILP